MIKTKYGIWIPDVPIMKPHNLPTVVKGYNGDNDMAVDMGLPSGLLWAKCDIDVTKPRGFADTPFTYEKSFFSWGNIDGHNPVDNSFANVYDWGGVNDAEPWYGGQPYGDTKGNTLTGDIPVDEEYDAARANLGEPWRTPASNDFRELLNNSIYIDANGVEIGSDVPDKRVTVNNIIGIYLQSKLNGARLFFSASGIGSGSIWSSRSALGDYQSRTHDTSRTSLSMYFGGTGINVQSQANRCFGLAVRAVRNSR